jgi:hypothetical protein
MVERKKSRAINLNAKRSSDNGKSEDLKRFYELRIEFVESEGLKICTNGDGFNAYEILGFLELVKTNVVKSLEKQ